MKKMIPKITELYDSLEESFGDFYKKDSERERHPGAVNGINRLKIPGKITIYSRPMKYSVAKGFLYPVLGSFRALVRKGSEGYYFIQDPVAMLRDEEKRAWTSLNQGYN